MKHLGAGHKCVHTGECFNTTAEHLRTFPLLIGFQLCGGSAIRLPLMKVTVIGTAELGHVQCNVCFQFLGGYLTKMLR